MAAPSPSTCSPIRATASAGSRRAAPSACSTTWVSTKTETRSPRRPAHFQCDLPADPAIAIRGPSAKTHVKFGPMSAERVEQLRKIALFSSLKPQALELIARVASEESHATGTKIFQHGDAGDKLYL